MKHSHGLRSLVLAAQVVRLLTVMVDAGVEGVEFIAINTDAQALTSFAG
jgi:hypothetical protein